MHENTYTGPWLSAVRPRPAAPVGRMVVLPHSGAGPNALLALLRRLPADLEVLGLTLPGRERRFAEEYAGLPGAAEQMAGSILDELHALPALPTVLFGHSLGACLAVAVGLAAPKGFRALVISGHAFDESRLAEQNAVFTEPELLSVLRLGTGTPAEFLEDPSMRAHILGVLGSDLSLGRRLAHLNALALTSGRRLSAPLVVLGGAQDQLVDAARLPRWEPFAAAGMRLRTFEGGHFYLLDDGTADEVAGELVDAFDAEPADVPELVA